MSSLSKEESKLDNSSDGIELNAVAPFPEKKNHIQQFFDSFKRAEISPEDLEYANDPSLTEAERNAFLLQKTPFRKSLKSRHLQMIAIGGSVGTGLFIGSGSALRTGGAASLPICWCIVGVLAYCTIHALGEVSSTYPISGAFSAHATRFIEPSVGFAIGWNYVLLWLVVLPSEIIAASLTIQFWDSSVNPVVWVAIFYCLILTINIFGVRGYGEAEYFFSMVKVIAILGFLVLGIVLVCGGGPSHGFVGGINYRNPGPFTNGFKGVCTVFVTACYSVGGSELVGVSGAESSNPRKELPKAIKQVFWRMMLFFVGSLTLISLLVNAKDQRLLGTSSADAEASPFVIAIKNGGIKGLPSVMNAVILMSVISVGNASVFGCSRTLASLSTQGLAPSCFSYVDRMGRPIFGIAAVACTGLLAFTVASDKESTIFSWLMALCGLSIIFTWCSINISHIRFRLAMKAQGRSLDELTFTSHAGIWGSVLSLVILVIFLFLQFWVALWPVSHKGVDVTNFFQNYLGAIIVLVSYIGRKIYKRKFWEFLPLNEIPLDAGRAEVDIDELQHEIEEEEKKMQSRGRLYRWYRWWC
ncbi:hypothetical protein WICMUC_003565 [Wickerhamomyces mucosus]|uniref:Amino acid permease/ SLC12A domain-containing protein n=1 Tax=Wickerhamomyces mucosus TaxID=1378264 RepID=A0A9P8PLL8_9ASCO|nr:hypothetical protein WICMUC_003565 [Wickerhamomyces mucosus]